MAIPLACASHGAPAASPSAPPLARAAAPEPRAPAPEAGKTHEAESPIEIDRREFTRERQRQLDHLGAEITRLGRTVRGRAGAAHAERRAHWVQRLHDFDHDQRQLALDLHEANLASLDHWAQKRSELALMINSLATAVAKIDHEVRVTFSSGGPSVVGQPSPIAPEDLCALHVVGSSEELQSGGGVLVVQLVTTDEKVVWELRQRAAEWAERTLLEAASYAHAPHSGVAPAPVSDIRVEDIEDGVLLVLVPWEGHVAALRARLEQDVAQIRGKSC